jgi:hypothetical protein
MKKLFAGVFLIIIFFASFNNVYAQATCDQCGYCPDPANPTAGVPSNWKECKACLYPAASDDPTTGQTLQISEQGAAGHVGPTPKPGSYFTMIGCISTGDFTNPSATGGFIKPILNIIFSVAGGIAFLYILYGAFQIATSQNDPEKLNYGKRLIMGAVIGLVFTLSSLFIINLVGGDLLKIPGIGQ